MRHTRRALSSFVLALAVVTAGAFAPAPLAGRAAADAVVPLELRAQNRQPGYCAWCSLQSLAAGLSSRYPRDDGLKAARKLVDVRAALPPLESWRRGDDGWYRRVRTDPGIATPELVRDQLTRLGVRFVERPETRPGDEAFLRDRCDRGFGAAIGLRDWPVAGELHAVAALGVSRERVTFTRGDRRMRDYAVSFLDPNDTGRVYRASLTWVRRHWSGWAVSLDPREIPAADTDDADPDETSGAMRSGRDERLALPVARPPSSPHLLASPPPASPPSSRSTPRDEAIPELSAAARALVPSLMRSGMTREQAQRAALRLSAPPVPRKKP